MEIKDSGCRREFETGAVRDDNGNKGRCDLIPLDVATVILGGDKIVEAIDRFMKEPITRHLYNALYHFCNEHYDGEETTMLLEVAKHFEAGALKYSENNWRKGLPPSCYLDSTLRHYLKFKRGDDDEPHQRAVVWNLMCCIWEVDYHDYNN